MNTYMERVSSIVTSSLKMFLFLEIPSNWPTLAHAKVDIRSFRNLFQAAVYLVYLDEVVQSAGMPHD